MTTDSSRKLRRKKIIIFILCTVFGLALGAAGYVGYNQYFKPESPQIANLKKPGQSPTPITTANPLDGSQVNPTLANRHPLAVIIENHRAQEKALLKQFTQATGQSIRFARAVYSSETPMIATRALELGIVHEITEGSFAIDNEEDRDLVFVPKTSAE